MREISSEAFRPPLSPFSSSFSPNREFLSTGAKAEINIDGKTMEATKIGMKVAVPSRYTFEVAAEHVYTLLLKKDCYPRFIRSEHYKQLMNNSINPSKPTRK
jgi:regulator of G-protein signaling